MKNEVDYEHMLTNEQLLKRFKNQFELVRYAIQIADNAIRSGRELDVDTDSENLSFQVLAEIAANKERFDELPVYQEPERPNHERSHERSHDRSDRFHDRSHDRSERFQERFQEKGSRSSHSSSRSSGSFMEQAKEMKKERKSSKAKASNKA